jgi:hypothetical protein
VKSRMARTPRQQAPPRRQRGQRRCHPKKHRQDLARQATRRKQCLRRQRRQLHRFLQLQLRHPQQVLTEHRRGRVAHRYQVGQHRAAVPVLIYCQSHQRRYLPDRQRHQVRIRGSGLPNLATSARVLHHESHRLGICAAGMTGVTRRIRETVAIAAIIDRLLTAAGRIDPASLGTKPIADLLIVVLGMPLLDRSTGIGTGVLTQREMMPRAAVRALHQIATITARAMARPH